MAKKTAKGKALKGARPQSTPKAKPAALAPGTVLRKLDRNGNTRCECTVEGEGYRDKGIVYGSLSGFIVSQKHLGWEASPDRYDDGGFTGANMDRPALQRLLADIEASRVDVVVVYKVDRLSRSLLDFARSRYSCGTSRRLRMRYDGWTKSLSGACAERRAQQALDRFWEANTRSA
jgi:hypothetical protein